MTDYYEQPKPFSGVSPILILGIVIFVLPFFNNVIGWNLPGWVSGVGTLFILIGAAHSLVREI